MIQELFTEKLRPKQFEHLILPGRIKKSLNHGSLVQNLLLIGSPGTGKTSSAKVLASNLPYIYINVSDESSVDIIRERITNFCSSISVLDGEASMKVIILDEIDGASDQFFKALRGTIEKFAKNCRFIATCNYVNKVPEAVQSRFEVINFEFLNKEEENEVRAEWNKRLTVIFQKLGIQISDAALEEFIDRNFPDMRTTLNKIQNFSIQGVKELTIDVIRRLNFVFEDLYNLLVKPANPVENYKHILSEYNGKVTDVMAALGNEFIDWLVENKPEKQKFIPMIVIEVAKHQAQKHLVIDPIISLLSLVFSIQKILND